MKGGWTGTENNVFNETGPSQMTGKSCKYISDMRYLPRRTETLRNEKIRTGLQKLPDFHSILGLTISFHFWKLWDQDQLITILFNCNDEPQLKQFDLIVSMVHLVQF